MTKITIDRSVVEQALEALENCTSEYGHRCIRCDSEVDEGAKVVEALRAALAEQQAEPVQEPVAWRSKRPTPPGGFVIFQQYPQALAGLGVAVEPLYTAPPPQVLAPRMNAPQRKPLTEGEIEDLYFDKFSMGELKAFARAIEQAHGIGEKHE